MLLPWQRYSQRNLIEFFHPDLDLRDNVSGRGRTDARADGRTDGRTDARTGRVKGVFAEF